MIEKMKSYHVAVAAEAFVAALCAQAGLDVSIQYGANQPEYDLIAKRGDQFLAVSVKGSQDGGWGLVQNYKKGRTYSEAIDAWQAAHGSRTVFALVQFWGVSIGECPRVYLATPADIAREMKASRGGVGNTTLLESWAYKKGIAKGLVDTLPETWRFSKERAEELMRAAG